MRQAACCSRSSMAASGSLSSGSILRGRQWSLLGSMSDVKPSLKIHAKETRILHKGLCSFATSAGPTQSAAGTSTIWSKVAGSAE